MTERQPARGPLTVDQDAIYERASDAFGVLGGETRLQILLALWDAYDPLADTSGLSFSELRDRVGTRDSGQFSYHLNKLVGEFVRKDDDGYTITAVGDRLVRAVVGTVGLDEPEVETVDTPDACPLCGGPTELQYSNQHLTFRCTECPGRVGATQEIPRGSIARTAPPRAAFANRTVIETWIAASHDVIHRRDAMLQGTCMDCMGPVDRMLLVCPDHGGDGEICETCGHAEVAMVRLVCTVCKQVTAGTAGDVMVRHPDVLARCGEFGVPLVYESAYPTVGVPLLTPDGAVETTVDPPDPPEARVTITHEKGAFSFTIREDLEIGEFTAA